jgi:two-component sensor histidine kinase
VSGLAAALGVAAVAGWGAALALAVSGRRRFRRVLDAEHELRGAAAAIGLAAERLSRTGSTVAFSSLVRLQLDRMAAGLEDLAEARALRRAHRAAKLAEPEMEAGRLAQVLGNLIANATEHGVGSIDVSTSRPAGAVRIEIRNRNRPRALDDATAARAAGRGRGLAIAQRAARELGGELRVESRGGETRAELELPAPDAERMAAEAPAPLGSGGDARADAAARAPLAARGDSGEAAAGGSSSAA